MLTVSLAPMYEAFAEILRKQNEEMKHILKIEKLDENTDGDMEGEHV